MLGARCIPFQYGRGERSKKKFLINGRFECLTGGQSPIVEYTKALEKLCVEFLNGKISLQFSHFIFVEKKKTLIRPANWTLHDFASATVRLLMVDRCCFGGCHRSFAVNFRKSFGMRTHFVANFILVFGETSVFSI